MGAAPDAGRSGDEGADTLSNLSVKLGGLTLPFLLSYGIGSLTTILGVPPVATPLGSFGKMRRTTSAPDGAYLEMLGDVCSLLAQRGQAVITIEGADNAAALEQARAALEQNADGLIFVRLPELGAVHGPRRDAAGYLTALQTVDRFLPRLVEKLGAADLLIFTSDSGCDPTYSGSGPTQEEVPLLGIGPGVARAALGLRLGFADIAQTLCDAFGLSPWPRGESLLPALFRGPGPAKTATAA